MTCAPVGDVMSAARVEAARYELRGAESRTVWRLAGCEIDVTMSVTQDRDGALVLRETHHACATTGGPGAFPCCESGDADLTLRFGCAAAGDTMTWTAALAEAGAPTGPWRGRGPWRGCADDARVTLQRIDGP